MTNFVQYKMSVPSNFKMFHSYIVDKTKCPITFVNKKIPGPLCILESDFMGCPPHESQTQWAASDCTVQVSVHYQTTMRTAALLNTSRLRQNGSHFPDDIFKCIFMNEDVRILIKISLKFVPKDPINNNPALVQIMAWHRSGDKPLSEPMMVSLQINIRITQP